MPLLQRRLVVVVMGIFVLILAACASATSVVTTPTATPLATATVPMPTATPLNIPTTTPVAHTVIVYFSKNPDSGNNFAAVFPVTRTTTSVRVGTFGIEQLILGPTAAEATTGLFSQVQTVIPGAPAHGDDHCGPGIAFALTITAGVARMQFCEATTSGGIGDDARVIEEIQATLKQFSTIATVKICTLYGDNFGNEGPPVVC